jgi:Polyketide cyclase / dehydrase and lipid transport
MSKIYVKSERVVNARPETVYDVLSDYQWKRPRILTPNFLDYNVERGGRGAGTIVNYRLQAARRERPYRIEVEEPVKGSVISERDTNSSLQTVWTLLPLQDGQQTRVSLVTEWEGSRGVGGFFERTFAPLGLRRIYNTMLSLLEPQVQGQEEEDVVSERRRGPVYLPVVLVIFALVVAFAFVLGKVLRKK